MNLARRQILKMAALGGVVTLAPWLPDARESSVRNLKITGFKTFVVKNVAPYVGMRQWVFVQLFTDQGLAGIGERPAARDFPLETIHHAAKIFRAIREAVGDKLEIGIGTHGQCGGILESKKVAGMAEAYYATIAPHIFCAPVAAAIQIDTCSPNFLIQEYNTTRLHDELFREPLRFERGFIIPPAGPGLGVELDEKVLKRQLVS